MRAIHDPEGALSEALAEFPERFDLPLRFPDEVLAAAELSARRVPDSTSHADRTDLPFVTLDPASSTDLDQAFCLERAGENIVLRYAIADVGWFVAADDAIDREAWVRGMTVYLPGQRIGLYPPVLSEDAASLLPDGPRPAVIFTVRVAPDGTSTLDGVERAVIRSRAKLAYETLPESDLPDGAAELANRIEAAELKRGAARVDPPEQELHALGNGCYALEFRPRRRVEDINACLSMAANLAVAELMAQHHTGLFRVMREPDRREVRELRVQANALGIDWSPRQSLQQFERRLDPHKPIEAAMMLAIRRAGIGATYAPFDEQQPPWHAAIAARYAHATAPLRRLADRYVIEAALALANGRDMPDDIASALPQLPPVMARAGQLAGRVERAAVDLAEAFVLADRVGQAVEGMVIASKGDTATVQLCGEPVILNLPAKGLKPGQRLPVRIISVDRNGGRVMAEPVTAV